MPPPGHDPASRRIIREQRFARRIDDQIVVTGKIDKVDLRQGLIVDAKTKEDLPKSVDDMPGYVYQLNTYRWILADGWNVKTGEPVQVPITSLGLVVHTMTSFRKYAVPVLPEPEFLAWFLPRRNWLTFPCSP